MKTDNLTCGFIGLGLIGGSMARALKSKDPSIRIISYTPHPETSLKAKEDGIVDEACDAIDERFSDLDYIFLCAPIERNNDNLKLIKPYLTPRTTLTDIGSVKTSIHEHVKALGLEEQFIGGHPMAGTERIGYINSKASILENAFYILTKTEKTSEMLDRQYTLDLNTGELLLFDEIEAEACDAPEKTDEELRHTAELWLKIGYRDHLVTNEEISCTGCKPENWCRYRVTKCCEDKGISNCSECVDYPCANMKECFEITKSFEPKCREVCTDSEFEQLKKAFFEKEENLHDDNNSKVGTDFSLLDYMKSYFY